MFCGSLWHMEKKKRISAVPATHSFFVRLFNNHLTGLNATKMASKIRKFLIFLLLHDSQAFITFSAQCTLCLLCGRCAALHRAPRLPPHITTSSPFLHFIFINSFFALCFFVRLFFFRCFCYSTTIPHNFQQWLNSRRQQQSER